MKLERKAGIILHPTSLPGPDGIGDLGPEAYRWVNFLASTGCALWQVLPLGPTGYGDSPYQCFSAFAGNPFLISPAVLLADELLTAEDLADRPDFPTEMVDYGPVINWKLTLLDRAYAKFSKIADHPLEAAFKQFLADEKSWLEDFALFMAIKESQEGQSWNTWPADLRSHETSALDKFLQKNPGSVQKHAFRQFLFFRQWEGIKQYANSKGIQIVGDAPIFVAYDSADAWAHPDLFYFDRVGKPTVVAGVPPDYFSATGQLWGNPLYRWDIHAQKGFAWWIARIKAVLKQVDIIRLDHFRGFAGYWEVPAGMPTAEKGRWVPGPGAAFFTALKKTLGDLPIIAEDLGEITPDVIALRDKFALPGMKILHFAFAKDAKDLFLPHHYIPNCLAYTGTHDNDTSRGWFETTTPKERDFCRRYLASSGEEIAWDMIRVVWSSVAASTLAPLQDFLGLGSAARMNLPGRASGNWGWRVAVEAIDEPLRDRIYELNWLYDRLLPEVDQTDKK